MIKTSYNKNDVIQYRIPVQLDPAVIKMRNINYTPYFNFYTYIRNTREYVYPICEQKPIYKGYDIKFDSNAFKEKYFGIVENNFIAGLQTWQKKAIWFIHNLIRDGKKGGMIISETATGKSIIIGGTIAVLKSKTVIVVPNQTIAKGIVDKLNIYCNIGILKGKEVLEKGYDIAVVHYQTFNKYYNELNKNYEVLIIDEVHKSPKKRIDQINLWEGSFVLGLTATPQRKEFGIDGYKIFRGKDNIFISGAKSLPVIAVTYEYKYTYSINEYIKAGEGYKGTSPEVLRRLIINNQDRINKLVEIIKQVQNKGYKRFIIFTDRVEHINKIRDTVKDKLNNVYYLYGETKDKDGLITELNNKDEYILFAMLQMAGEGTDITNLEVAIQFVSTKRINSIIQGMGRTKRIDGKKTRGIYIDFVDKIKVEGISKTRILGYKKNVYKEEGINFISYDSFINGIFNY